jgi:hypothetical protein
MRKKAAGRKIEVNLEELDRIIDHGTRAPLSESDDQKIKAALHAMADRLTPKRNTEKTSAVLPGTHFEACCPADGEDSAGHGRNGVAAFAGASRVMIPHAMLQSGNACPECSLGKVYRAKGTGHVDKHCRPSAAEGNDLRNGAAPLQRVRTGLHRRGTRDGGSR